MTVLTCHKGPGLVQGRHPFDAVSLFLASRLGLRRLPESLTLFLGIGLGGFLPLLGLLFDIFTGNAFRLSLRLFLLTTPDYGHQGHY